MVVQEDRHIYFQLAAFHFGIGPEVKLYSVPLPLSPNLIVFVIYETMYNILK